MEAALWAALREADLEPAMPEVEQAASPEMEAGGGLKVRKDRGGVGRVAVEEGGLEVRVGGGLEVRGAGSAA